LNRPNIYIYYPILSGSSINFVMYTFHEEPTLKKARIITDGECDDLDPTHLKELSKDDLVSYILYLRSGVDELDAKSKFLARYQNGS
jgi:hypothetical protein